MSIKQFLRDWYAKRTGRNCASCAHNRGGRCCHPDGNMFMRCWHSITRPGYEYSPGVEGYNNAAAAAEGLVAGIEPSTADLTPEELHQLGKIVETLQQASETARDGGLLDALLDDKTESGLLEED